MAEEAERTAYGVVRRVGGVGLLDNRVFLSGTGKGVQAVSIIDIPLTKKIEQELNRCGLIEAI
jgi:hypothetical protein